MNSLNIKKVSAQDIYAVVTNNVDKHTFKDAARLMIEQMMYSLVEITQEALKDPQGGELSMPSTQDVKNATVDFLRDMLMDLEDSLVVEIQNANVVVKLKPIVSFEATLENAE